MTIRPSRSLSSSSVRAAIMGAVATLCLTLSGSLLAAEPGILIHGGDKIGFMGDSITAQGDAPDGYIGLVIFGLKVEGIAATPIPAGVPGHTSANMRSRLEPQILSQGATWMTLSCGVNDVLMKPKGHGVELDGYKANVTAMVEAALARHVQVVLMTPTPLGEDLANDSNAQLATYVDFLRAYATEKHLRLADVNAAFLAFLKAPAAPDTEPGKRLLADGVHPNKTGQALMARTVLLALGVPPADLPRIDQAQADNPLGKGVKLAGRETVLISPNQYQGLVQLTKGHPAAAPSMLQDLWNQALRAAGAGAEPTAEQKAAAQAKLGPLVDAFIRSGGAKAK